MKKFHLVLCSVVASSALAFADGKDDNLGFDTGRIFVGAELGLSTYSSNNIIGAGVSGTGVNLGVIAGYHYYFPSSWQFADMRHGVRGYGTLNYGYIGVNSMFLRAGADWTIDFTPHGRYVWGAFAGLSLGGVISSNSHLGWSANFGGSLELKNKHRFEAALGWGYNVITLRYIYKF